MLKAISLFHSFSLISPLAHLMCITPASDCMLQVRTGKDGGASALAKLRSFSGCVTWMFLGGPCFIGSYTRKVQKDVALINFGLLLLRFWRSMFGWMLMA